MQRRTLASFLGCAALSTCCIAQTSTIPCPEKAGIYFSSTKEWIELPQEANPVTTYKPNFLSPALPKTNKEFAGEKAFITLHNPVQLCVVNASSGASFSLEKAVAKKGTRTIVQVGDFHSNKGAQSQAMASITDAQGNIHLMTATLFPGQYMLVMLGGFKPIPKPATGNAQADAMTAAMDSSAAVVAAISRTQGLSFGFGIE